MVESVVFVGFEYEFFLFMDDLWMFNFRFIIILDVIYDLLICFWVCFDKCLIIGCKVVFFIFVNL